MRTYIPIQDDNGSYWKLEVFNGNIAIVSNPLSEDEEVVIQDLSLPNVWKLGINNGSIYLSDTTDSPTDNTLVDRGTLRECELVANYGALGVKDLELLDHAYVLVYFDVLVNESIILEAPAREEKILDTITQEKLILEMVMM